MLFFPSFKNRKKEVVALVDIGDSSIGASFLLIEETKTGRQTKTIGSIRNEMVFLETLNFKRFFDEVDKALKKTLFELIKNTGYQPTKTFCFLSSPFYVSQTKILNYENPKPFTFTKEFLGKISCDEAAKFLENHQSLYPEILSDDPILIENKIMQIRLNGYDIIKPFGKTANKAVLSQYLSLGSKKILKRLKEVIKASTNGSHVEFHSFMFSAYSSLRDLINNKDSFMFVDVGGELTDVAIVTEGVLQEGASYPYGKNSLIRQTVASLSTIHQEASTLLKLYVDNNVHGRHDERLALVLAKAKEEWISQFKQTLGTIMESTMLPETVYFIGDEKIGRLFATWLSEDSFKSYSFSNNPLKINFLDEQLFAKITSNRTNINNDAFLMLETIFYDKISKGN